jgi:predicted kinase
MEVLILIGIQGAGKSTFCQQRFFDTHIRINLDMLRTRRREACIVDACFASKQRFVVDNTNPTQYDRSRYIKPAKAAGFKVIGYYFEPDIEACDKRNQGRPSAQVVPSFVLKATCDKMQKPSLEEGFDKLYSVRVNSKGKFVVKSLR